MRTFQVAGTGLTDIGIDELYTKRERRKIWVNIRMDNDEPERPVLNPLLSWRKKCYLKIFPTRK